MFSRPAQLLLTSLLAGPWRSATAGEAATDLSCSLEVGLSTDLLPYTCTCSSGQTSAHLSLAGFLFSLPPDIYDRLVTVTVSGCWRLTLTMDHLQLYRVGSRHFRPDLQVLELQVEDASEVRLGRDPAPVAADDEFYQVPGQKFDVLLYNVGQAVVDPDATFGYLVADNNETQLHVDLSRVVDPVNNYPFDVEGFSSENIFFITDNKEVGLQEGEEFKVTLRRLEEAVLGRSRELSLALGICVCLLVVGIGAMMGATVRRHQITIKTMIYDSLRRRDLLRRRYYRQSTGGKLEEGGGGKVERKKPPVPPPAPDDPPPTTLTTKVDFFPKYMLVKKSDSAPPDRQGKKGEGTAAGKAAKQPSLAKHAQSASFVTKAKLKVTPTVQAGVSARKSEPKALAPPAYNKNTSFLYQGSSQSDASDQSKYDLTVSTATAQVHRHKDSDKERSDSDGPASVDSQEMLFSNAKFRPESSVVREVKSIVSSLFVKKTPVKTKL